MCRVSDELSKKTPGQLREELKHALTNVDKLSNRNTEIFHEMEMYKAAYEELSDITGRSTLEPHQAAYNRTLKKLRERAARRAAKQKGR